MAIFSEGTPVFCWISFCVSILDQYRGQLRIASNQGAYATVNQLRGQQFDCKFYDSGRFTAGL